MCLNKNSERDLNVFTNQCYFNARAVHRHSLNNVFLLISGNEKSKTATDVSCK